jgi:hypothetical protein
MTREFARILREQGWGEERSPRAGGALPGKLVLRLEQEQAEAAAVLLFLRRGNERLLLADFGAAPFQTHPPETAPSPFEHYLDLGLLERLALWAAAQPQGVDFLLCASAERTRLFDAAPEVCLGECPTRGGTEEVKTCLRALDPSRGNGPPQPGAGRLAEDLARWFDILLGTLGPALAWSRGEVERVGQQILLGLKVLTHTRPMDLSKNLARLGFAVSVEGDTLKGRWAPGASAELADRLLLEAQSYAPREAGAFSQVERRGFCRQLQGIEAVQTAVLRHVVRLAAVKLRAPLSVRVVMPADWEPVAWRLGLMDPLRVDEEIESRDFYVFGPLRLDLTQCGMGRIFEAVEKIALGTVQRGLELERAGGRQLDMVEEPVGGRDEREPLLDPFNWLCRRALRVTVAPPYRRAVAYLVASHVLDLRAQPRFARCHPAPLRHLPAIFEELP